MNTVPKETANTAISPKTQFQVLSELRQSFANDLKAIKNPGHDERLILQAKIIAIGQAIDALGLSDDESSESLDELIEALPG
jgi:hypothetical protein